MSEHKVWCGVCEAGCGLVATVENGRVEKMRPDRSHPLSEGFACPKGILYPHVLRDPDRILHPMQRQPDGSFRRVGWEEALDDVARRFRAAMDEHGGESIGVALGNPGGWNYGSFFLAFGFAGALGTHHLFSAASVDINPYWVTAYHLFGNNLTNPIPDFDRAHFQLLLGANPAVSHGSMVTAGNIRARLRGIVERGGRVVVVDPRRTETAEQFEHVPVRPNSDVWLLGGMLRTIFDERLEDRGALAEQASGVEALRRIAARIDLDRAAAESGVPRATIEQLARDFATAPSGSVYGRCGTSLSSHGTLTKYFIDCLNIVTGRLDRAGGICFPRPFFDAERVAHGGGMVGYDRWRTRVDGVPEVYGTTPQACLPREISTPGKGQLRALLAVATNLGQTAPRSTEVADALQQLDFFVSLDPYITDTNKHAAYVLPPRLLLERDAFPLWSQLAYVVPNADWTPPIVPPPGETREDWWIIDQIGQRMGLFPKPFQESRLIGVLANALPLVPGGAKLVERLGLRPSPADTIDWFVRTGQDGDWFGLRRGGLNREKLRRHEGAIKLADRLETGVLRRRLYTDDRRVQLAHALFDREAEKLVERTTVDDEHPLRLFTIRELRTMNSFLHNIPKLVHGYACRARIHPDDAAARGIVDGATVRVTSRWGSIVVEAKVTDEVMPGSVGMNPHYGQHGGRRVAAAIGGGRYNDLTPNEMADLDVSGIAWMNGIGVEIAPAPDEAPAPAEPIAVGASG